jgi:hypothetical protein
MPLYNSASLQFTRSGTTNAVCLVRYVSNPAELNFSDSPWSFACWFERTAATNHDFVFYIGAGDGFSGDGDELQFYCPSGSSNLALAHYNSNNVLDVSFSSPAIPTPAQWHHAALVFERNSANSGLLHAFLDGTEFGVTNVTWTLQQQMPIVFGGHNKTNTNVNRWFGGWLDDLVLFTNSLSPQQISSLATRTLSHFGGLTATNTIIVTVTNYAPPKLANRALTNGVWTMSVNGDFGATYAIQTSTNLANWTTLWTTNPAALPFYFTDNNSNRAPFRFYRALIGP